VIALAPGRRVKPHVRLQCSPQQHRRTPQLRREVGPPVDQGVKRVARSRPAPRAQQLGTQALDLAPLSHGAKRTEAGIAIRQP